MGRIGTLLSFIRTQRNGAKVTDVKVDPGGGDVVTAEHFSVPGIDANPLSTDTPLIVSVEGSGREAEIGYNDPTTDKQALSGEVRIYARDSSGNEVVSLWVKNDGSHVITNGLGNFSLQPDGTLNLNGVMIDPTGRITAPNDIIAGGSVIGMFISGLVGLLGGGKSMVNHAHPAGSPPGNTGPNI